MSHTPVEASAIFLKPGEWLFGRDLGLVKTILGSCVAVTMFCKSTGRAAICHAILPECLEKEGCSSRCKAHSKYAKCIIPRMAEMFLKQGIKANSIEVKLFGGSHPLRTNAWKLASLDIGKRNVEQARKSIEEKRLMLKNADVGGMKGRALLFDTSTGEITLRRLGAKRTVGHDSPRGISTRKGLGRWKKGS